MATTKEQPPKNKASALRTDCRSFSRKVQENDEIKWRSQAHKAALTELDIRRRKIGGPT